MSKFLHRYKSRDSHETTKHFNFLQISWDDSENSSDLTKVWHRKVLTLAHHSSRLSRDSPDSELSVSAVPGFIIKKKDEFNKIVLLWHPVEFDN